MVGAPTQRTATVVRGVCVCANVRVRTSVHACVRDVFAIYDDNIFPRLIMIIIKIIILYFIRIRHTDDFPSTGKFYLLELLFSIINSAVVKLTYNCRFCRCNDSEVDS